MLIILLASSNKEYKPESLSQEKRLLRMVFPTTTHVDNPSKEEGRDDGFRGDPSNSSPSNLPPSKGFGGGFETDG
ncbi:hypothetical protein Bca4012_068179 [Brassica carinata]|uniref:Uncharacterized protein n=1 Tax=Brassica carinata TaxID=52824 RepID=A0A8X8B0K4_BRACI|nr:hypothetical protein Bca52824_020410 [Brassica carinata]